MQPIGWQVSLLYFASLFIGLGHKRDGDTVGGELEVGLLIDIAW